jgi:hypothetical protein
MATTGTTTMPATGHETSDIHPKDNHHHEVEHATDSEKAVDSEKAEKPVQSYIPQNDDDYDVTWKTWVVVGILSASYGISFWIVPSLSACGGVVATQLGDVTAAAWYVSIYLVTITIAFMICGGKQPFSSRRTKQTRI